MVTPELISYIKSEVAKGKTREDIRTELVYGGWSDLDLSEAFRVVMPMQQGSVAFAPVTEKFAPKTTSPTRKTFRSIILVVVCVVLGVLGWSYIKPSSKSSTPQTVTQTPVPVIKDTVAYAGKDCGATSRPDLKVPLTYENNAVLNCIGASALNCENAKAVLNDASYPTNFEILNDNGLCKFKLSYSSDSTLLDAGGQKLSGQSIFCPVSVVKAYNATNPQAPTFEAPSLDDAAKYASQIYFYGTLGVFVEKKLDYDKIQSLGCSGGYVSSIISSYQKVQ